MIHGPYAGNRLEILAVWDFQKNLEIFAQHLSNIGYDAVHFILVCFLVLQQPPF